jgi:RNA polymerase primary sigma factor
MEDNSLNIYLDIIGRQQVLSDEQERQLSERIRQGDQRAVSRLVEANLRFVVKVASQYRGQGLQLDDLISEGNLGMMAAAAKFDATRGARFISYAAPFVRRQIEKAIEQQNGIYKIPRDAGSQARQNGHPLSVDAPLGGRTNMSLLSVLVNNDSPQADERVYSQAIENAIEFALLTLTPRESEVINRFFGLDREHETMAEIAEDLDLKRERIRQIRDRAIRRLKKNYRHRLKALRETPTN